MEQKQTSKDLKDLIVKYYKESVSIRKIAAIVEKPRSTVFNIIKTFKKNGTTLRPSGSGRPSKISSNQTKRRIVRYVQENSKVSIVDIAKDLKESGTVDVHPQTIRNFLHKKDYRAYTPRKKPFLSEKNIKKRLEYAKCYINKPPEFWKSVIFTDESKFNIFGSDGRRFIWRREGIALEPANVVGTVKHGGGSVMVWGAMAASGASSLQFIEGIMNKMDYLNILKQNIPQTIEKLNLPARSIFLQDNDPKHTALIVKEWLLYNTKSVLPHPPQSPDLNPIEHLWAYVEKELRKRTIHGKSQLKDAIQEIWNSIPEDVTSNLVTSMNRRLEAVIKAKGHRTKY